MRYHKVTQRCIRITLLAAALLWFAPCPSRAGDQTARRGDPAARLSSDPEASELWNLTAHFDGGYRLFTWFFITNEGPGERTAAAIWYLVHPDGRVAEFRNGRQKGRWKLSPDRRRIDVASSSLDLRGPGGRVAIDSTSQRVKIDLQFAASGPVTWPPASSPSTTSTLGTDTLQISAPVEGTIWDDGLPVPVVVRGTAALTHAWMDESLPRIVQRRIEFFADQPQLAFYLSDIRAPSGDDRRWLVLERGGTLGYQSSDFEMTLGPSVLPIADRGYPIPGRLLVRDGRISLDIHPQRLLVRTNPLEALPQPFRFIYSLRIEPQWVWVDASFHLQLTPGGASTGAPLSVDGRGILAVTFVNPLRRPE
jgi:hypothetical protein